MDYVERILPADNPINAGYWYLVDGEPWQSEIKGDVRAVRGYLGKPNAVVQYCDMVKRGLASI